MTNNRDSNICYSTGGLAGKGPTFAAAAADCDDKDNKTTSEQAEKIARRNSLPVDQDGQRQRTRFNVALLGLAIAVVNCYAQATFCISIVEMVLPADYSQIVKQINGSAHSWQAGRAPEVLRPADSSCPLEYKYRFYYDEWRFQTPANNNSNNKNTSQEQQNPIDVSNRFDWDASQQGLLLGAFAIGTAPLQVIGGRLAEIYGAKWVLLAGCIGSALTNLTIPAIAHFSFLLLILNRVLMGVAQAGMEPGLMCLLAKWLTPAETGYYISMLLFAICIGFFLGSLCSSFILSIGYGWPLTFYVSGSLNLLIGLIWFLYASSLPEESKIISKEEFVYIKREQAKIAKLAQIDDLDNNTQQCDIRKERGCPEAAPQSGKVGGVLGRAGSGANAPWRNILSTPSVWAFIICKFSIRWCVDVLTLELPIYLANVLHLSIKLNGILNSISSALFAIFSFLTGYLADRILISQQRRLVSNEGQSADRKRKLVISKTNFRKLIQSIASFGSALSVFLMTKYDCNILLSMSMMLLLSCLLVLGTGGELQIPYDMTPSYPGTLHGMACTVSVSGWLAPPLIGLILADQPTSRYRWSLVWYLTACINLFGGLVFVLFADASPRNFDNAPKVETTSPTDNDGPGCRSNSAGGVAGGRTTEPSSLRRKTVPEESEKQLNWRPLFDRELIKVRQLEDSYIERPSYLADFDSILLDSESVIFPYREEKDDSLSSSGQLLSSLPGDSPSSLKQLLRRLWYSSKSGQLGPETGGPPTELAASAASSASNLFGGPFEGPANAWRAAQTAASLPGNPADSANTITHL